MPRREPERPPGGAPGAGEGFTTLGLDEGGLEALKNSLRAASLYADALVSDDDPIVKRGGTAILEDIEVVCEALRTDLEGLWEEYEAKVKSLGLGEALKDHYPPRP